MTAVEWLEEQFTKTNYLTEDQFYMKFKQAKEMEKQQIVDFGYDIADDLACGVFRDKKAMEKRYDEFLVFRSEDDDDIQ